MLGNKPCLVMKFGGTSVGSVEALEAAAGIVEDAVHEWPRLVVVTSALSGVTNILLESASGAASNGSGSIPDIASSLLERHLSLTEALIPDHTTRQTIEQDIRSLVGEFSNLCHAIAVIGEASPRVMDAVAALGERMSVRLLAGVFESRGIPATWVESTRILITNDNFMSANPEWQDSRIKVHESLVPLVDSGRVAVVTGFIGSTHHGVTTTLGRGGSDFSAAILAALLPADELWIWTDVNGVMTCDPRLVPDARTIPELSFREISELAYFGAKVLHPKSIRPVIDARITLRVLNTFNPDHPGTLLLAERKNHSDYVIQAVTAISKLKLITLEGRGMLGVPGVAARTFSAVAATGTSVPLITQASSEQSICFAVPTISAEDVLSALEKTFEAEMDRQDIDRIWATEEVVIITIVGQGMRNTPGISGKIFSALGAHGINVIAIAQGSSEVSISAVINATDEKPALQVIHDLII